jgi:TatA/E family protein of Tat protein translocase
LRRLLLSRANPLLGSRKRISMRATVAYVSSDLVVVGEPNERRLVTCGPSTKDTAPQSNPISQLSPEASLGGGELVILLTVVLVLFGAKRLPEMDRGFERSTKESKKGEPLRTNPRDQMKSTLRL